MKDFIKEAAKSPLFQPTLMHAVNHLTAATHILASVGIDITSDVGDILTSISKQLAEAAYEMTDVLALLEQASSIGDDVEEKEKFVSNPTETFGETDNPNKN